MLIVLEEELCVCELTEALQEIQPKISRHLAQLRECGLLLDRRQGQWVFYRLNDALPDWAKLVLKQTTQGNEAFFQQNKRNLCCMGDRPDRTRQCQ